MANGLLACIPLLVAAVVTGTLAACYALTMGHWGEGMRPADAATNGESAAAVDMSMYLPEGVLVPAISALGMTGTARRIYQVGFGVAALGLAVCVHIYSWLLAPHLVGSGGNDQGRDAAAVHAVANSVRMGYVCALGIALQGMFTLDFGVTPQSIVHWGGALLFVYGANAHCMTALDLYIAARRDCLNMSPNHNALLASDVFDRSIAWKKGCLNLPAALLPAVFGACIVAQVMLGSSGDDAEAVTEAGAEEAATGHGQHAAMMLNAMGAVQWMVVYSYVLYFISYSLDAREAFKWEAAHKAA